MNAQIKVVPDVPHVASTAADQILLAAQRCITQQDRFSLALAGGHTPEALYTLLSQSPYRQQIDWTKVEVFFGDERCVRPDSPESNFGMAHRALLSKVPIPGDNLYRMRGEIAPEEAAKEYGLMLKEKFGDRGLDIVLLGMGDDGHTASLFPHTEALKERDHRCVANFVPKLKTWRLTLSAPFINRSEQVMVLVAGEEKAARAKEVLEGPREPERLPIQLIEPASGQLLWIMDAGAAGMNAE
jgi:6-phosphogluconolactonase